MAAHDQQVTDELVLRDLPGKLAILVFALATLALAWEASGILLNFGLYLRPLESLDLGDVTGIALFTVGWFGLLIGLLVLRDRRDASAD